MKKFMIITPIIVVSLVFANTSLAQLAQEKEQAIKGFEIERMLYLEALNKGFQLGLKNDPIDFDTVNSESIEVYSYFLVRAQNATEPANEVAKAAYFIFIDAQKAGLRRDFERIEFMEKKINDIVDNAIRNL